MKIKCSICGGAADVYIRTGCEDGFDERGYERYSNILELYCTAFDHEKESEDQWRQHMEGVDNGSMDNK